MKPNECWKTINLKVSITWLVFYNETCNLVRLGTQDDLDFEIKHPMLES